MRPTPSSPAQQAETLTAPTLLLYRAQPSLLLPPFVPSHMQEVTSDLLLLSFFPQRRHSENSKNQSISPSLFLPHAGGSTRPAATLPLPRTTSDILLLPSPFFKLKRTAIITGLFILQNNAVSQRQRGAANGISMTGQSMFKAIAPATAGAIFSWAQKHRNSSFLPGNHMVFLILNMVLFVGLLMMFKPFLASTERRR